MVFSLENHIYNFIGNLFVLIVCLSVCLVSISFLCAPEGIEGFLSNVVFTNGVLKADVETVFLVHHMEARILITRGEQD